jgi:hypothetical protein
MSSLVTFFVTFVLLLVYGLELHFTMPHHCLNPLLLAINIGPHIRSPLMSLEDIEK